VTKWSISDANVTPSGAGRHAVTKVTPDRTPDAGRRTPDAGAHRIPYRTGMAPTVCRNTPCAHGAQARGDHPDVPAADPANVTPSRPPAASVTT
jgi:hypothetical protein